MRHLLIIVMALNAALAAFHALNDSSVFAAVNAGSFAYCYLLTFAGGAK